MHEPLDADVLIIGAGPAGAATAILLRSSGWRVILVEKSTYPRQKVCGECLSAASFDLLDRLGVGELVRERAGPELTHVGWWRGPTMRAAPFPACQEGSHRYGRAVGRDLLDTMLITRAIALGVTVIQPARVRAVKHVGAYVECVISTRQSLLLRRVPVVIDAHGSWENPPEGSVQSTARPARRGSDLFGFKASFDHATLSPGLLPVLSYPGGYGGLVLAEAGRLTLAGCVRRDTLATLRSRLPGTSAAEAFEQHLRDSCHGVRQTLLGALRSGPWLIVGPLRPPHRLRRSDRIFAVGNAASETHPLIGEGMNMALESAFLLTGHLIARPMGTIDAVLARKIHRAYDRGRRRAFARRARLAALYAYIAMRPPLSRMLTRLVRTSPQVLTWAARLAGKARKPGFPPRIVGKSS